MSGAVGARRLRGPAPLPAGGLSYVGAQPPSSVYTGTASAWTLVDLTRHVPTEAVYVLLRCSVTGAAGVTVEARVRRGEREQYAVLAGGNALGVGDATFMGSCLVPVASQEGQSYVYVSAVNASAMDVAVVGYALA